MQFDKDGMYPPHACKCCGKLLNADGNHPAELYAGTYTGLCYTCEKSEAFKIRDLEDGCQIWSHPPHCPSWRRDREMFYGFPGCPDCGGKGRKMIERSFPRGGPYPVNCPACFEKHFGYKME